MNNILEQMLKASKEQLELEFEHKKELAQIKSCQNNEIKELKQKYKKKISDLEAKLADSEGNNKLLEMQLQDMERSKLAWENKYFKLEQQLAEKEKENDDLKRIGEKSHLNDLLEDKRKENGILIKAIEQANQDKISFAVEQLEKVKNRIESKVESVYKRLDDLNIKIVCESTSRQLSTYEEIVKEIDNQIKAIKGEK